MCNLFFNLNYNLRKIKVWSSSLCLSPLLVTGPSQNRLHAVNSLSQVLSLVPCLSVWLSQFVWTFQEASLFCRHIPSTSPILKLKALANTLSLLFSQAIEFSPFWCTSHSVHSNSFQILFSSPPPFFCPCYIPSVCVCVCVCCVCVVWGTHYYVYILFLRFYHIYVLLIM